MCRGAYPLLLRTSPGGEYILIAGVDLDFDCVYQQSASSANTIVSKEYGYLLDKTLTDLT
jgi:hypothetical protein